MIARCTASRAESCWRATYDRLGPVRDDALDGQDVVDHTKKRIECRLNSVAPVDRDAALQDLLEHLRVGHEPRPF